MPTSKGVCVCDAYVYDICRGDVFVEMHGVDSAGDEGKGGRVCSSKSRHETLV